jgi:hypothetical protein
MRRYRACDTDGERGVALVEFALVLPILLVILMGMLEFGKALNYRIDETQLASTGARWAVVSAAPGLCPDGSTASSLQSYIQCQADSKELRTGGTNSVPNRAQVCISFPPVVGHSNPLVGDPVRVSVSVVYKWLPIIGQKISAVSTTLKGESTMRLEAPPTSYAAGCYPA